MVSAEERKKQALASVPKDAQTSSQKSELRITSNKTRGGYTSQKERALKYGGKYREGDKIVAVLSKDEAIKQGIERARESNKQIREYDKITDQQKQDLINKYGERKGENDNEKVGNREDVYYRDIEDQTRVKEEYSKRTKTETIIFSSDENKGSHLQENLNLFVNGENKPYQKTRKLSAREIAEGISEGRIENQYIGKKGADIKGYETEAYNTQKFKSAIFPTIYTDKGGKELFTITGQSKGSKFDYFIRDKKKEAYLNNLMSAGKEAKPINANAIFNFPLEAGRQEPKYKPGEAMLNIAKEYGTLFLLGKQSQNNFNPLLSKEQQKAVNFSQEEKDIKRRELFNIGPLWSQETIKQALEGKPLTGTGKGLGYDIESGASEAVGLLLPTKRLPISSPTFKAVTESGEVKTIARTFDIGYGKYSKSLITKVEGGYSLGSPLKALEKSSLKEIESLDRGLELSTQGALGTKILTSEEGLGILEKAGKVLPRDVEAVKIQKQLAEDIGYSQKVISTQDRVKVKNIPNELLSSLEGKEHQALTRIIPKLKPIKGTASETLQLEKQFLPSKGKDPLANLRLKTTKDLDIDYQGSLGKIQAHRIASESRKSLQEVAGKGRKFVKSGTNVNVESSKGKETVLNILTDKDAKTGYLNKNPLDPFSVKLKGRTVKIPTTEGKLGKFVTIEENALHRIESSVSLQGPKAMKYAGKTIPYLKEGAEIQRTPKGYTLLPSEHRLKDLSKLVSQDVPQIGKTLKKFGHTQVGLRVESTGEKLKELYPEIDFSLKESKHMTISSSSSSPSIGMDSIKGGVTIGLQSRFSESSLARREERRSEISSSSTKSYSKPSVISSMFSTSKPSLLSNTSKPSYLSKTSSGPSISSKPSPISKSVYSIPSNYKPSNFRPSYVSRPSSRTIPSSKTSITSKSSLTKSPSVPIVPKVPIIRRPKIVPIITRRGHDDSKRHEKITWGLKTWRGNVPETSLLGIYKKESEISYKPKRRKTKGSIKRIKIF